MSEEVMSKVEPAAGQPRSEIKEIIERAITDPDFKQRLLDAPDQAMEGYALTDVQKLLVKSLNAQDLAKLTPENLEEYFSADAAVYTPDESEPIQAYETYAAEDLQEEV